MKRFLIITLILALLVAAILLWTSEKPAYDYTRPKIGSERAQKEGPRTGPKNTATIYKSSGPDLLPQVTMTAVKYEIDPLALNRERENPPFEFRGGAGTGRVIDRQGNVLLESNEEIGIFGAIVGPDKEKVLVDAANRSGGSWLVLVPSINQKIQLPVRPPGSNMFSISWNWIGPNLLLGVSGIERIHENPGGMGVENCCNDDNVAQTKFYTFNLITNDLSEVIMPKAVTQPVVNAVNVMSDGHIHLSHDKPQEGAEQDLGWFKINTSE